MTDMSTDAHDLFTAFLKNHDTTEPRNGSVGNVRKAAFRAALGELGAEKVRDLNPRDQDILIQAFRIPDGNDRRLRPSAEGFCTGQQADRTGPAINLDRAVELARETGENHDACVCFLKAQADGHGYQKAARVYAQRTGEAALACASMMNRIMVKDRELSEAAAQKDGKLWTIRGAVSYGRVDFLIVNGRSSKTLEAMVSVEFPDAIGVIELTTMGTRLDAMTRAAELVNLQEYGFRFL